MANLAPRKYERHVSRIGGTSGGLGRGSPGFWPKVKKLGLSPGCCWEWIGYLDKEGYGKFTTTRGLDGLPLGKSRTFRPHRVLWEHVNGPIPDGLFLLHFCDNPRCLNPDHLRPGTQLENIHDMMAKGRKAPPPDCSGELSPTAKLREADVLFIRSQPRARGLAPVLARIFTVRREAIDKVRKRETWTHLGNGNKKNAMPLDQLRTLADQREIERAGLSREERDHAAQSRSAA